MNRHLEPEMLKVRAATVADADTISSLNDEVQNVHAEALPHLFKPASRETFSAKEVTEILTQPDNHIFLAYFGEEPAGYIYCEIRRREESPAMYARDQVYVLHVSVNRSHQRKGVATALFSAVTALAKDVGIRRLGLDVWSFNADAIDFFEREGFEIARHIMIKNL